MIPQGVSPGWTPQTETLTIAFHQVGPPGPGQGMAGTQWTLVGRTNSRGATGMAWGTEQLTECGALLYVIYSSPEVAEPLPWRCFLPPWGRALSRG